jgi:hypothetical protein
VKIGIPTQPTMNLKHLHISFGLMISCLILLGCQSGSGSFGSKIDVRLGDSESVLLGKMKRLNARNVTNETRRQFYEQTSREQKYYWWELPDKTIVAVLLAGDSIKTLKVVTCEVGDPGRGVAGIEEWRSQKRVPKALPKDDR